MGSANDDGDVGDPVLAVDRTSRIVYLAGTSSRNAGHKGIPLWTSTDGGVTFTNPVNVRTDINYTDKPWIAVDNAANSGLHDLYLTCTQNSGSPRRNWLTVSADGLLNNWTTASSPTHVRSIDDAAEPGLTVFDLSCPIVVIGSDHVGYVFWIERTSDSRTWLRVRKALNRGTALGAVNKVSEILSTGSPLGNFALKRTDNPVVTDDTFRAYPFPVPAVNPSPSKWNHLYVAYADKGEATGDNTDIFLVRSINGGDTWPSVWKQRVNSSPGVADKDQWMPVLAVKPDGTKLFVAWYDRRNDPNNSLIEVYGRWGNIATDGTVSFGTEFKISTASFPPVFAGTLPGNLIQGHYDPAYPPEGVNLNWWYPGWPLVGEYGEPVLTESTYIRHVGEYDGAWAEGQWVYVTWTDNRLLSAGTSFARSQRDIRLVKMTWP